MGKMSDDCLIVIAGEDLGLLPWREWVASAPFVIAADGGANLLVGERVPDVIVGDGDSIHSEIEGFVRDEDQDTTDCEKALAAAQHLGYERVTLLGVEGSRLDHVLATIAACVASNLQVRLLLRLGLGYVLRQGSPTVFRCEPGATVSLLPLSDCVATMLGVEWPLEGVTLRPEGPISISNRACHSEISARVESGVALLFVHQELLPPHWD